MNHRAESFFFMHMQILLYINKITISYLHSLITKSIYKIRKGVRLGICMNVDCLVKLKHKKFHFKEDRQ